MQDSPRAREDALALAELERERAAFIRYARRFTHCLEDAEDAVQATALIAMRRADVNGRHVRPWLFAVIRNQAITTCRRGSRTSGVWAVALMPIDSVSETLALPEVDVDGLLDARAALLACKPDERLALIGRAAGWTYAEIAAANGWTYTKVNRSVSEGRARVRELVAA
ncbi:MAG: hypothetical protein M3401_18830 [Actinomycetota bacterium]|nr:hypothetical protein [Actinomycetota bacterium]